MPANLEAASATASIDANDDSSNPETESAYEFMAKPKDDNWLPK